MDKKNGCKKYKNASYFRQQEMRELYTYFNIMLFQTYNLVNSLASTELCHLLSDDAERMMQHLRIVCSLHSENSRILDTLHFVDFIHFCA